MDTMSMEYLRAIGKCEEVNESSYERVLTNGQMETVSKVQLSLVIPGMRDRLLCEMALENAPKPDVLDKWELEEAWVVVSAEGMRALAFERNNARLGEKKAGALVVFQATDVREATADERKALQQARKAQKVKAKQVRTSRQAERKATKEAEKEAEKVVAQQSA